jgi:hypothetical protein
MAATIEQAGGWRWSPWRITGWGLAASLLLLPAVAMRFTPEVNWTAFDFVFAAALIGGVGVAFEVAVRMTRSVPYRSGVAVALAAAFLLVWVNGAVGMIGSEDNPFNLLFLGVIALALAGAIAARFRAAGTARAMIAAAVAQGAIGVAGMAADLRGGVLSAALAGLGLLSAALFRKAASADAAGG